MWRCDNVGGLGEHVTCRMFWVLSKPYFLWSIYVIGQTIIFLPCYFYLLSSIYLLFFPSPSLSGRRLDVYQTLTQGVALARI